MSFNQIIILIVLVACQTSHAAATFQEVLKKIGEESSPAQAARYQALSEKALSLGKRLSWSPTITASAIKPIEKWGQDTGESVGIEASLNIFKFGGGAAENLYGRKQSERADLSLQLNEIQIEAQAARVIFNWLELQRRIQNLRAYLTDKRELVRVAHERFKRGQLPAQEVDKVRLDANNSEIEVRQAEVDWLEIQAELEAYLPGASDLKEWPWTTRAGRAAKPLQSRFEWLRYDASAQMSKYQAWQSKTNWLPRVDLNASLTDSKFSTLGESEWTVLGVLTIPLWDGGQNLSGVKYFNELEKKSLVDKQNYEKIEAAKLKVIKERQLKLKENVDLALRSTETARELAKDNLKRFRLGRATVNDLLIDQSRQYAAENLTQSSLRQYHLILLEMCLAADEKPSSCY